jgi:hypothetical protein
MPILIAFDRHEMHDMALSPVQQPRFYSDQKMVLLPPDHYIVGNINRLNSHQLANFLIAFGRQWDNWPIGD